MGATNGMMLRVLLNRHHHSISESPLHFLPERDQKAILSLQIDSDDPTPLVKPQHEQLSDIHYSWMIPAIKLLPVPLHAQIIACLPAQQALKLKKHFDTSHYSTQYELSTPLKTFLTRQLYAKLKPSGILPLDYIQETPLSILAKKNKQELMEIIDFLGLYDLAESIRHIIDKHFLQKLYRCLSQKQKQFLRNCLHQQEKIATARMDISSWHGDCKALSQMLQRRGLNRLGKALHGLHPDFIWHLTHTLDSGRGTILLHHSSTETAPGITSRLVQQVLNLNNFLNSKSSQ